MKILEDYEWDDYARKQDKKENDYEYKVKEEDDEEDEDSDEHV
jgi:hypothetical protein